MESKEVMGSKKIIANIDSIYERFNIPPNLIWHMKKVASVGALICDNWNGGDSRLREIGVNKEDVVAFLLVHDLGNIIKFRFDTDLAKKMIGTTDEKIVHYWKNVRLEVIKKYGNNVGLATLKMLSEIGVNGNVSDLIENMDFAKADIISKGNDWKLKICTCSDFRVGPFGVVSLKERIDDLRRRYQGQTFEGKESDFTIERAEFLYKCYFDMENQVMKHCKITPEDINEDSIRAYYEGF